MSGRWGWRTQRGLHENWVYSIRAARDGDGPQPMPVSKYPTESWEHRELSHPWNRLLENSICQPGDLSRSCPPPQHRVTHETWSTKPAPRIAVESKFTFPGQFGRTKLRSSQNAFLRNPGARGPRQAAALWPGGQRLCPLRAVWARNVGTHL